mmetsp:Transcript_9593/g.23535  ORF Transcript_9593/g.23535 Transcript_9593/m.23535 type:complete len:257 (-) Transcript_9593:228-998(-)
MQPLAQEQSLPHLRKQERWLHHAVAVRGPRAPLITPARHATKPAGFRRQQPALLLVVHDHHAVVPVNPGGAREVRHSADICVLQVLTIRQRTAVLPDRPEIHRLPVVVRRVSVSPRGGVRGARCYRSRPRSRRGFRRAAVRKCRAPLAADGRPRLEIPRFEHRRDAVPRAALVEPRRGKKRIHLRVHKLQLVDKTPRPAETFVRLRSVHRVSVQVEVVVHVKAGVNKRPAHYAEGHREDEHDREGADILVVGGTKL